MSTATKLKPTLLVVEDAPFLLEVLVQLLEKAGYNIVAEARNGREAVELAQKFRPDLILMDLVLPEMSGIEATQSICEQIPGQKIIALTTLDQEGIVLQALEAGCCHYLMKPFESKNLLTTVKKALE